MTMTKAAKRFFNKAFAAFHTINFVW